MTNEQLIAIAASYLGLGTLDAKVDLHLKIVLDKIDELEKKR
jgi:hypothetical protein